MIGAARLASREKQIQYGYNTDEYKLYLEMVRKEHRGPLMPSTPKKHRDCSKRSFDGQIRLWRRALHAWDLADTSDSKVSRAQAHCTRDD